jgi:flagellar protein FliL
VAKGKKEKQAGGGGGGFVIGAVFAVVMGIAGGFAFGYLAISQEPPAQAAPVAEENPQSEVRPGRFPKDAIELAVPSIITELDASSNIRARLDVSIIVAHGTPEATTLIGEVREDVIAYFKGLTLTDIQGPRGFQNLREQLDDRARIRGRGAILGLLIAGIVLE